MKTCATCPRPLNAGSTAMNSHDTRCLICRTAELFKGWQWPPKKGKTNA